MAGKKEKTKKGMSKNKTAAVFWSIAFFITAALVFAVQIYLALSSVEIKKDYYPNGNIRSEQPMLDGVQHGVIKWYYPDGTLKLKQEMHKGKTHGDFTFYYPDGKPSFKGSMKNNKRNGKFIRYDEDGKKLSEEMWKDNIKMEQG
ncbi:MAG: toxin-antitoxin system YwqK family antitoxin [bacterium]